MKMRPSAPTAPTAPTLLNTANATRRRMLGLPISLPVLALPLPLLATGCVAPMPPDAFQVSEDMLGQRQRQSRRFNGISEQDILVASSNVLQDMGFNLENSEVSLGVMTANKQRDATNAGEVVGAVFLALMFGVMAPVSKSQSIRVSLVVQPAGSESAIAPSFAGASTATGSSPLKAAKKAVESLPAKDKEAVVAAAQKPGNYVVRVTFQRVVTRTDNSIYVETIDEAEIYQEFFDKLSKSVFIEGQEI
ncbi:MAG: hypothetical protein LRY56_00615 [Burkholderiaceae bacterium]|nr:hypothetical protein [Burkholderiaceae bacterium]MCD8517656.1 hypothetical protein [Burkholderiaceae bacterium]MCD8536083.1 hypothetical protein [Burkholderiaceae bacterium]